MVNTGQIMAEFGLTEADIASAARTSMPGEKPTALLEALAWPNDCGRIKVKILGVRHLLLELYMAHSAQRAGLK